MSCKGTAFVLAPGPAHSHVNDDLMESAMLLAIESFVRLFETLLVTTPVRKSEPAWSADNDNDEMDEDDRRWAAFR